MKYLLSLPLLLLLCTDGEAMTYRRHRAKEGFMGAPARDKKHRKASAAEIAGAVVTPIGNAAIDELRRRRTHTNN